MRVKIRQILSIFPIGRNYTKDKPKSNSGPKKRQEKAKRRVGRPRLLINKRFPYSKEEIEILKAYTGPTSKKGLIEIADEMRRPVDAVAMKVSKLRRGIDK